MPIKVVDSPEAVTNVLASSFGRILTRKFNFHVGLFNMIFHYMQDSYRGRWEQQKSVSHRLAEVDRLSGSRLLDGGKRVRISKKEKYMNLPRGILETRRSRL